MYFANPSQHKQQTVTMPFASQPISQLLPYYPRISVDTYT
jgi:hypothetical protein